MGNLARTIFIGQDCTKKNRDNELTRECLKQHWKCFAGYVQLGSLLHDGDHFRDDGVLFGADAAIEANDTDHRGGIAFIGHDIVLGVLEDFQCHHLALIVLKATVTPHQLQADTHVSEFSMDAPSVAIEHRHDVGLAQAEFAEHDHPWSRRVDGGTLVEHFGSRPRIANPYRRIAAYPVRDHGRLVLLGHFLKVDPWLGVR